LKTAHPTVSPTDVIDAILESLAQSSSATVRRWAKKLADGDEAQSPPEPADEGVGG
jgi:hypothetical protein